MAPRFQAKLISFSKIFKNFVIFSIIALSFFLILFSKSDYYLINGIKSISTGFVNPISKFISAPFYAISNINREYIEFKNLKFENKIFQEEIIRLKKWQSLAIQKSRKKVLKKLLNATNNNLKLIKTASLVNRNDLFFLK